MKVYISGPITGTDDYMERFEKCEKKLVEKGYTVVNPAKVNAQLPIGTTWGEYMEMSITMLKMCDTICFMKGWQDSKGACVEYGYARALRYHVLEEIGGEIRSAV